MEYDISREQVENTYIKIKNHIIKTPVIYATKLSNITSFKLRGALSKMMALEPAIIKKGVVAASAGNHSQGVSFAANLLNVPATIVMPKTAPISKINATKNYGVEVILHGDFFDDANKKALEIAKTEDKVFVHAFNDLDVIIGQGTIGIEILEDLKEVDYILVPIGGGGILSGIASYVKAVNPNCKLIGVQSQNVPSYYEARKTNQAFQVQGKLSIADGIAVKQTGDITFSILNKYVDDVILVSEAEIAETILFLFENCKIVAEGAGAVTTAAMLFNKLNVKNKKIVCVLSGGNIDVTTFLNITNRALINQRRRVVLKIDAPLGHGHLTKITNVVDSHGVQIHKISDSQLENSLEVNREIIRLVVDINRKTELANIVIDLEKLGYTVMEKEFINSITK
ncbi:threonine ammonia-lyase [Spiroplasma sp. SV19]|uniref:threonine ammonia-lyase n=1 Tax=Spiroplasma sp. SV19 TaxID=2570468 RepID=UPI0024B6F776|nr:threonine ammonia-lyase [Spiroplasma sp. SV19]WHQ36532.1 threonine ammonia-lyase [Spiroplasma sp. SV19]